MALPDKFIIFLGRTFSGHNHDYLMLKQEFPPELDWFTDLYVRVDLGYLGIKSDYCGEQIAIPTRKPRKSQKNPNPQLSDAQKAANTALSRVRIFIEHGCVAGREIDRFIDKIFDPGTAPFGLVIDLHLLVNFAVIFEPAPVERKRKTRPGPLQLYHLSRCVRGRKAQAAQHHKEQYRTTVSMAHAHAVQIT